MEKQKLQPPRGTEILRHIAEAAAKSWLDSGT
jgi:hypothetical protein